MNIETARLFNTEFTSQVTRKLDKLDEDILSQILDVINSAITEKVLPSIKNALGVQKSAFKLQQDGNV